MKRLLAIILCAVFVLSLAACGGKEASVVEKNITDSDKMMSVETEIGTLYYPLKWEGKVAFSASADKVDASCGEVKLFTVYFGGDSGDLYGMLKTGEAVTELRYDIYDFEYDGDDIEDLYAMQEDINVIFQYLIDEGRLTIS